jgi:uncharacterized protein YbaR (Trm112 family)
MISNDLLEILCCPDTHQDLELLTGETIERINAKIRDGAVKNRAGDPVETPIDSGLLRADRQILYPVREDIPVLLVEEGIPFDQFEVKG